MHTVLSVSEVRIRDKPYYRSILSKALSDHLQIQAGDTLTVEIKAVKRDGEIIYSSEQHPATEISSSVVVGDANAE